MDAFVIARRKRVHLDQFQKQNSKSTECLPQHIDVVHAVGQ